MPRTLTTIELDRRSDPPILTLYFLDRFTTERTTEQIELTEPTESFELTIAAYASAPIDITELRLFHSDD